MIGHLIFKLLSRAARPIFERVATSRRRRRALARLLKRRSGVLRDERPRSLVRLSLCTLQEQLEHLCGRASTTTPLDIHDREALIRLNQQLPATLRSLTWSTSRVATDRDVTACWILCLLHERRDIRRRFPLALSSGQAGQFCRWLCDVGRLEYGVSAGAVPLIEELLRDPPGDRVRQVYEHCVILQYIYPLALTPVGAVQFVRWLLAGGRREYGFSDIEIWWFLQECAESPARELARTYCLNPRWQRLLPDAMLPGGRTRFLAWLAQQFDLRDQWLPSLGRPEALAPGATAFRSGTGTEQLPVWSSISAGRLAAVGALETSRTAHAECLAPATDDKPARPRESRQATIGLNVLAHFRYPSGLQQSARSIVTALRRSGASVCCRDVPVDLHLDVGSRKNELDLELHDVSLIHVQPEPFFPTAYARAGLAPRGGVYRIGYWYWEFETIPPEWTACASLVDEIWAATQFVAQGLERTMPRPVTRIFPGVELSPFQSRSRAELGLPENRTLFLFMFDMRSIMERKNPLGLIRAFRKAFRPEENVSLVLKVSHGSTQPKEFAKLSRAASEAGVILIDRVMSRGDSYALIEACDCYVSLHRSEGLGLTMAEAMLMGKPVIATAFSGNVDFMDNETSMLVEYKLVPLERSFPPYQKGWMWAEPAVNHAAHWMRWVFEHPQEARELGERAKAYSKQELSLNAAGQRIQRRLEDIEALRRSGRAASDGPDAPRHFSRRKRA